MIEKNVAEITLNVKGVGEERYSAYPPSITVGNLFVGETFIEPQGPCKVVNETNGFICRMEFLPRKASLGLRKKEDREKKPNQMRAWIEDSAGRVHYRIEGNYYEKLYLINEKTGERTILFEAPKLPPIQQEMSDIYGMNYIALQLNNLSDEFRAKLPPTDCRLRPDMRAWESCDHDLAQSEKDRIELNQDMRNEEAVKRLTAEGQGPDFDPKDQRTFYNPQYFTREAVKDSKTGKVEYLYKSNVDKYWEMRSRNDWSSTPRIYDDDCAPYY